MFKKIIRQLFFLFSRHFLITLIGISALLFIRLIEFYTIHHYQINEYSVSFLLKFGAHLDVFFCLFFSIWILPFIIISNRWSKIQTFCFQFYKLSWILFILLETLLTHFFISSDYLLTSVVFEFKWSEIYHIIQIENETNRPFVFCLYTVPILYSYLILRFKYEKLTNINIYLSLIYILLICIIIKNNKNSRRDASYFKNQYEYYLGNNKTNHFIHSFYKRDFSKKYTDKSLIEAINAYHKLHPSFNFNSLEYPLMHDESTPNTLGKYFKHSKVPPNIIFIISEGLSGGISGLHPTAQSLTPFVDSLAKNGLYWSNFLSNCFRTFGVLPNSLGSLISGTVERGFVNFDGTQYFGQRYPTHQTLPSLLHQKNYHTSFFYGGWGDFDNYFNYLKAQSTDLLIDFNSFDSTNYLSPSKRNPGKFCWGYDDKSLFSQWLDEYHKGKIKAPFHSILLTLNMHEPYNITPTKYTNQQFINQRLRDLKQYNNYKNRDPLILGSIFYYDDAVKYFFKQFSKTKAYKNTIFILFGDHHSFESYLDNPLEIYHVPFIIFSPLIKQAKVFKGVSTHLDITPSLTSLLSESFNIQFPKNKHWISEGLDTSQNFNCNKNVPFAPYSLDFPQLLLGDKFLHQNKVYQIKNALTTREIKNAQLIKKFKQQLKNYQLLDYYTCTKNKIYKK